MHQGSVADVAIASEREELVAKVREPQPAGFFRGWFFLQLSGLCDHTMWLSSLIGNFDLLVVAFQFERKAVCGQSVRCQHAVRMQQSLLVYTYMTCGLPWVSLMCVNAFLHSRRVRVGIRVNASPLYAVPCF